MECLEAHPFFASCNPSIENIFKDLPNFAAADPFSIALITGNNTAARSCVVFAGDQVAEYAAQLKLWKKNKSRLLTTPTTIAASAIYRDLPAPFSSQVDAAVEVDGVPVMYLFSGDSVLRYDAWPDHNDKNRVEVSPCKIATSPYFNELPAPFNTKVDAAVSFNEGRQRGVNRRTLLLFSGDQCIFYAPVLNYDKSKVLSAPCAIAASPFLSQLPPPFNTKIDAAVCIEYALSTLLLFSGNQFIKYSVRRTKEGNRILAGPFEFGVRAAAAAALPAVAAASGAPAAQTATVHPTDE